MGCFQIQEYDKAVINCLFNFYTEYIMQNAGLDESQAGIKIVWRNKNKTKKKKNTEISDMQII